MQSEKNLRQKKKMKKKMKKKIFLDYIQLLLDGFGITGIGQIVNEADENEMKYIYFFGNSEKIRKLRGHTVECR